MRPTHIKPFATAELAALDRLYRSTRSVRLCTRAQGILLAAENGWHAGEVAPLVRMSAMSILRWIKRYNAEGITRPGKPKNTLRTLREHQGARGSEPRLFPALQ